jgi:hypothetical protein
MAKNLSAPHRALAADVRAGLSTAALTARHYEISIFHPTQAVFAGRLDAMRRRRMGPFRQLPANAELSPLEVKKLHRDDSDRAMVKVVPLTAGDCNMLCKLVWQRWCATIGSDSAS